MFNVSREHEQSEQTRQLLAEHETILNNALIGITYLKHRRVVSCNRRFEEMFGYGPGELSGQSTECLYASRAIFDAVGERAYANCGAGRNHCEEVLLQRKDINREMLNAMGSGKEGERPTAHWDPRLFGTGAQILLDLGVKDMIVMSSTRPNPTALEGYGLRIVGWRDMDGEDQS